MKKLFASLLILFTISSLIGCTTGERQAAAVGGGVVVGGLAGSAITGGSTAGTIIGAGAGGLVGYGLSK